MEKRIFIVTGASGHLGNTLVRMLLQKGETVRGLVLPTEKTTALYGLPLKLVQGDVCQPKTLVALFEASPGCELIVLHTAGLVSITSGFRQRVYDVNVKGTENILQLCLQHHVKKLVYVSSVHAIPELRGEEIMAEVSAFSPRRVRGLYAKTKAEATQRVLDSVAKGLNASVVHPSGILGAGDYGNAHLTQLVMDYLNGKLFACVHGGYDFVDVRDVAAGILACAERGRPGECYILSNQYFSIEKILELLHQVSGRKKIKLILPFWLAKATAPLAELYYKGKKQTPLYTRYSLETLRANSFFSHQKAEQELGFHPREMETTLFDMVQWLTKEQRIDSNLKE